MSTSSSNYETHPGCSHSVSQLLQMAKKKLRDAVSGGMYDRCRLHGIWGRNTEPQFRRAAITVNQVEVKQNSIANIGMCTAAHTC